MMSWKAIKYKPMPVDKYNTVIYITIKIEALSVALKKTNPEIFSLLLLHQDRR